MREKEGYKQPKIESLKRWRAQDNRYYSRFENMDYRYPKLKEQNKQLKKQLELTRLNVLYLMVEIQKLNEQQQKIREALE